MLDLGANVRATLHRKEALIEDARVDYVRADLLLREDCQRIVRDMDHVFLCAANTSGRLPRQPSPLWLMSHRILL